MDSNKSFKIVLFYFLLFAPVTIAADDIKYSLGNWPDNLGNHRARILVKEKAEALQIHLPWRLHNQQPKTKRIIIINANTDKQLKNVLPITVNNEFADIVFEPTDTGNYFIYYMPYEPKRTWGAFPNDYLVPENVADPNWIKKNNLTTNDITEGDWYKLPKADLIDFQSRTEFDSFYPMEIASTRSEKNKLINEHSEPYLLFAEDRMHPIRMKDDIPLRWIPKGPTDKFIAQTDRNEYFTFQIGLFASKQSINDVEIKFSDLTGPATLPCSIFHCINLEGTDAYGQSFEKNVSVKEGSVQPLWIGIDIPEEATAGVYQTVISINPKNAPPQKLNLSLTLTSNVLKNRGDSEPNRYSRLRWLDSSLGINDEVIAPYTPLEISGNKVSCLGRQISFGKDGLPESIKSGKEEILSSPMRFVIETETGPIQLQTDKAEITAKTAGSVAWQSKSKSDLLELTCKAIMEFDGYINYKLTVKPLRQVQIKDIRLKMPLKKECATYMMGIGNGGCLTPSKYTWNWTGLTDSFWIGSVQAGIHCQLKGSSYNGPLPKLYQPKPPQSWGNNGKGGCSILQKDESTIVSAFSGKRKLEAEKSITWEFGLLITPVKQLDTATHFKERYYHSGEKFAPDEDTASNCGINIINVHHGNEIHPYINYPFVKTEAMSRFVDYWHDRNTKVKIYYTIRELSDYCTELWAFRSLGSEILADGKGGGFPWLREHLVTDYRTAWYQPYPEEGTADAAIITLGGSRLCNYYIEGLNWLVKNIKIDGVYLDDVSYDRRTLKRMRRVMDQNRPGCLIDLHSHNGFSGGPANQYTEFFPYVDRLWFGEGFKYNQMSPESWLVEVSGIPFGLMGDMLQGGGNPWRGMIYGMTVRFGWTSGKLKADPRPIWKILDSFEIDKAKMIGYWEPSCPIRTDNKDILATAYVRDHQTMVAIASWAPESVDCHLKIDWKALGLDPKKIKLYAPSIQDFQDEKVFSASDAISVEPAKGWLIIIK